MQSVLLLDIIFSSIDFVSDFLLSCDSYPLRSSTASVSQMKPCGKLQRGVVSVAIESQL